MPVNPNDTSITGPEALQRKLAELGMLPDPVRRSGGSAGAEGPEGPEGQPGSRWYFGTTEPSSELGIERDYYYRTTTGDVYSKSTGTWAIIDNLTGPTGPKGETGATGPKGETGATGPMGQPAGFKFKYSTSTTMADPGSGFLRFNAAIGGAISAAAISETSADSQAVGPWIQTWDDNGATGTAARGYLYVYKTNALTNYVVLKVFANVTDNGTWDSVQLNQVGSNGTISNGDEVFLMYVPVGLKGDQGEKGEKGEPGEDGEPGFAGLGAKMSSPGEAGGGGPTAITWTERTYDDTEPLGLPPERRFFQALSTKVYLPEKGKYAITAWVRWPATTSAKRVYLIRNETEILADELYPPSPFGAAEVKQNISAIVKSEKAGGDYIQLVVHDPGATTNCGEATLEIQSFQGAMGEAGPAGSTGATGPPGSGAGVVYKFSTTVTEADPGEGFLRFNNATFASVTKLFINETSFGTGGGLGPWLATWDDGTGTVKGTLIIRKTNTHTTYRIFNVTGTVTDNGSWDTLSVTPITSGGTLSNNDEVDVIFVRAGDKGDKGEPGENGAPGPEGPVGTASGVLYKFDSATTEEDPGEGEFRLNNAALASATRIYISETTALGQAISGYLATWDDSTTTGHRGYIRLVKKGTPTSFAIYEVTGALTDKGTYDSIVLTHKSSGGSFSAGDEVYVEFSRTGDKGEKGEAGESGGGGGWAVVARAQSFIPGSTAAASYFLNPAGNVVNTATATNAPLSVFWIDTEQDINALGASGVYRMRWVLHTNGTAPGALTNFRPRFYAVEPAGGGAGVIARKLSGLIMETESKVGLAASNRYELVSSEFELSTPWQYAFVLTIEGAAVAASASIHVDATLQVRTF